MLETVLGLNQEIKEQERDRNTSQIQAISPENLHDLALLIDQKNDQMKTDMSKTTWKKVENRFLEEKNKKIGVVGNDKMEGLPGINFTNIQKLVEQTRDIYETQYKMEFPGEASFQSAQVKKENL